MQGNLQCWVVGVAVFHEAELLLLGPYQFYILV